MAAGSAGNRVNKGQSSGPSMSGGSVHHGNMYFSGALWGIAKKLPPNERVECIEKKPKRISRPHLSDEEVMELIRMHKKGMTFVELAEYSGKGKDWIRNICNGTNRGHLLRMVEEGHSDYRMGWKHKK